MSVRFSKYDRDALPGRATNFINRLNHMNPMPTALAEMTAIDFYYACCTQEDRDAFNVINRHAQAVDGFLATPAPTKTIRTRFRIEDDQLPDREEKGGVFLGEFRVRIYDDLASRNSRRFLPTGGYVPVVEEGHELFAPLATWMRNQYKLKMIKDNAYRLVMQIHEQCNTAGQWKTVFPAFVHLLNEDKKRAVNAMQRGSPWPPRLDRSISERIPALTTLFAKCAVLPQWEMTTARWTRILPTITREVGA